MPANEFVIAIKVPHIVWFFHRLTVVVWHKAVLVGSTQLMNDRSQLLPLHTDTYSQQMRMH